MKPLFSKARALGPDPTFSHPHHVDPRGADEQGVTIPIVAGVLISLILLVGLALDSGNLYRARIRAQKAADAGVFAAGAVIAIEGTTNGAAIFKGKEVGESVALINLNLLGMRNATATVSYNQPAREVSIRVDVDTELMLLSAVPGMGNLRHIPAEAQVELQSAVIAAIVDTSGSMGCRGNNDCSCYPCSSSKADMLKASLTRFTQSMDKDRDFLSITRFSTGADTSLTMPALGYDANGKPRGGFDPTAVQAAINSINTVALPVQAASNFCDGFQHAYLNSRKVVDALPVGTETFFIVFSDANPDAGRFAFANPKAAMPPNNAVDGSPGWAGYDYYAWKVQFYNPLPLPGTYIGTGPQQLVRGKVDYEWISGQVPAYNQLSLTYPNCTGVTWYLPKANPFGECLNDWSFNTLEKTWKVGETNWAEYEKRFYDCPIAWSDYSRKDHYGMWYTVGFGTPCAPQGIGGDPYQGVSSGLGGSNCNHEIFMRRLAFSRKSELDPPFPDFDNFATMQADSYDYGDSTTLRPGDDIQERMDALFARIARRIKLRLIR